MSTSEYLFKFTVPNYHFFLPAESEHFIKMKFRSLEPFIPSGPDLAASKQLFQELGFTINWDAGDYIGYVGGECRFILQKMDDERFANNFMLNVRVDDVAAFRNMLLEKKLIERFGIRIGQVTRQPYGKEVNVIDMAGVCWHFVE